MRPAWFLSLLVVLALTGGIGGRPAGADTLVLTNGDLLRGELQVTELTVMTPGGVLRIGRPEISEVTLGTASGDVVQLRTSRTLRGIVDQPTYAIRLPSGQTVAVGRADASALRFTPR